MEVDAKTYMSSWGTHIIESTSTYMMTLEGPLHGGAVEYIVKNDNQLVQFAATAIFNEENYKSQGPSLSNC